MLGYMGVGRDMNSFISWRLNSGKWNFFDVMRKMDLNEEDEQGFIDQLTMLIRLWIENRRTYLCSFQGYDICVLPSIKNKLISPSSSLDHFHIRKRNETNVACLMHIVGFLHLQDCLSAIIVWAGQVFTI